MKAKIKTRRVANENKKKINIAENDFASISRPLLAHCVQWWGREGRQW
jgi:hypothetical protein